MIIYNATSSFKFSQTSNSTLIIEPSRQVLIDRQGKILDTQYYQNITTAQPLFQDWDSRVITIHQDQSLIWYIQQGSQWKQYLTTEYFPGTNFAWFNPFATVPYGLIQSNQSHFFNFNDLSIQSESLYSLNEGSFLSCPLRSTTLNPTAMTLASTLKNHDCQSVSNSVDSSYVTLTANQLTLFQQDQMITLNAAFSTVWIGKDSLPGSNEQLVVLAQNSTQLQIYKVNQTLVLWHTINLTQQQLQSLSFQNGQILFQNGTQLVSIIFCSDHQYYQQGSCYECQSKHATTKFQQNACVPCANIDDLWVYKRNCQRVETQVFQQVEGQNYLVPIIVASVGGTCGVMLLCLGILICIIIKKQKYRDFDDISKLK